ncbi:MAG: oxidoreductase [Burkholderiales bacterium]|jgi:NAD(P)-dependent dehydrogenase (short-subunit alcohol dehydrogenase family)
MASTAAVAPVWFITGCSTGLGRELAQAVLNQGHRAAVTARDPASVRDIVANYPDTALALQLDVANYAQIEQAVAAAEKKFGRVDVLVNNAGYGYLAAVEEGEEAEIRAMFETNFFGLAALIRRVLPGMRTRAHGHIINISSVGGLLGNPSAGYYNATKFAVEGLSEALAKEVEPLGLRVTVIEPGPFRTDWAGRSLKKPRVAIAAYEATAGARRAQISGYSGKQPGDPARAAQAIMRVVESPAPPMNLVLGKEGLKRVREKMDKFSNTLRTWEATTTAADFPDA